MVIEASAAPFGPFLDLFKRPRKSDDSFKLFGLFASFLRGKAERAVPSAAADFEAQAIAIRLEAIAIRLEAIATRVEAIPIRLEQFPSDLIAILSPQVKCQPKVDGLQTMQQVQPTSFFFSRLIYVLCSNGRRSAISLWSHWSMWPLCLVVFYPRR